MLHGRKNCPTKPYQNPTPTHDVFTPSRRAGDMADDVPGLGRNGSGGLLLSAMGDWDAGLADGSIALDPELLPFPRGRFSFGVGVNLKARRGAPCSCRHMPPRALHGRAEPGAHSAISGTHAHAG